MDKGHNRAWQAANKELDCFCNHERLKKIFIQPNTRSSVLDVFFFPLADDGSPENITGISGLRLHADLQYLHEGTETNTLHKSLNAVIQQAAIVVDTLTTDIPSQISQQIGSQ